MHDNSCTYPTGSTCSKVFAFMRKRKNINGQIYVWLRQAKDVCGNCKAVKRSKERTISTKLTEVGNWRKREKSKRIRKSKEPEGQTESTYEMVEFNPDFKTVTNRVSAPIKRPRSPDFIKTNEEKMREKKPQLNLGQPSTILRPGNWGFQKKKRLFSWRTEAKTVAEVAENVRSAPWWPGHACPSPPRSSR